MGGTARISLNSKVQVSWHFGFLMSRDQQARRGVSDLSGIIDSDYQEEGCCYTMGIWRNMCGNTYMPVGHMLTFPCPMVTVCGQVLKPQPEKSIMTRDSVPSETRVCVRQASKPRRPPEGSDLEWLMKEGGSVNCNPKPAAEMGAAVNLPNNTLLSFSSGR